MAIRFMRCTDATKSASTTVLESGQPLYNPDTSELFISDGQTQAKELKTVTPFVASDGAYTALLGTQNSSTGDRSVVVGHGNKITTTAEYANNVVVGANNTCHQISGGTIGASNKVGSDVAVSDGTVSYRGYTVKYTTAKGYSNNSLVIGAANVLVPGQYSAADLNKTAVANVGNIIGGYRNKIQGGSANILTGEDNTIEGFTGSSLFGKGLIASNNYQTIVGVYNADAGTNLFVVAGGEAKTKKNVFSVGKDAITANITRFDLGNGQINSGKIYCSEVNSTAVIRAPHIYKGVWTGGTWTNSGELATIDEVKQSMKTSSITVNSLNTSGGWIHAKNGTGQYAGVAIASPMFYKFTEADQTQSYDNLLPSNKEVASKISTAINAIDVAAITGSTTKTITSLSQTDGKVSATYSNIAFPVTSVAGRTGAITLTKSDVGLSNVDNTSDVTKKSNFTGSISSGNTGFAKGGDVYTKLQETESECKGYTDDKIGQLDYSASGSTSKTITSISQADGKISVTYGSIDIQPYQIRGLTDIKTGKTDTSGNLTLGSNFTCTSTIAVQAIISGKVYSAVYLGNVYQGNTAWGTLYLGDDYYLLLNPESSYSYFSTATVYKTNIQSKQANISLYIKAIKI